MPDQALEINQFLGIDNTSDMMSVSVQRKGGIYFYEIDNVNIDDNFKPHRRDGYEETPVVSCTSGRSLWASPSGKICLFVDGTTFYKLNTDNTTTVLVTGVDPSDTFAYVEVGNFVYFSNMSTVGYIDTRLGTSSSFSTPTQTFKTKMIGGQILEYHYNRLYAVNQENIFYSDATILTQMDSRKNAIALPSRGTMFKSVVDGVYVSDKEKVYFWAGKGPDDFVSREVLDVPVIEGMSASATVKKRKVSTKTVLFMTDKGLYEGYPEGIVVPKQGGLFSMTNLDRGTAIIKSGIYQQFISIGKLKVGTGDSSGEFIFIPVIMTGESGLADIEVLGNSSDTYNSEGIVAPNDMVGSKFECSDSGTALYISVYLKQFETATPHLKCAIYSDSSGTPDSLIGYTEQWILTNGFDGWKNFTIVSGGSLVSGITYWLVCWADGYTYRRYDDGSVDQQIIAPQGYNSFPTTFPAGTLNNNKSLIYCTFET